MSGRGGLIENLSPKAAAFSIENLLGSVAAQQTAMQNSTKILTAINSSCSLSKNANAERRTVSKIRTPRPTYSQTTHDTNYSVRNLLDRNPAKAIQAKKAFTERECSEMKRPPSFPNPLQQFAACCDLVRNFNDTEERHIYETRSRLMETRQEMQVALQHSDLWWKFYSCGTEMVITRTGRLVYSFK